MAEWRVDGIVGKGLYRDGVRVGWADTVEIAREIVETMNRVGALLADVRAETARERSQRGMWACCGAPLADHPLDRCPEAEPGDAQRRSEATPKNDLDLLGPSRVDPYDTTKGGITEP